MNSSYSLKSSWYKIAGAARNWINSVSQTEGKTKYSILNVQKYLTKRKLFPKHKFDKLKHEDWKISERCPSHAERSPRKRWVLLRAVRESAESCWALSEKVRSHAERCPRKRWVMLSAPRKCRVMLSAVRESAESCWALSEKGLSHAERCPRKCRVMLSAVRESADIMISVVRESAESCWALSYSV